MHRQGKQALDQLLAGLACNQRRGGEDSRENRDGEFIRPYDRQTPSLDFVPANSPTSSESSSSRTTTSMPLLPPAPPPPPPFLAAPRLAAPPPDLRLLPLRPRARAGFSSAPFSSAPAVPPAAPAALLGGIGASTTRCSAARGSSSRLRRRMPAVPPRAAPAAPPSAAAGYRIESSPAASRDSVGEGQREKGDRRAGR